MKAISHTCYFSILGKTMHLCNICGAKTLWGRKQISGMRHNSPEPKGQLLATIFQACVLNTGMLHYKEEQGAPVWSRACLCSVCMLRTLKMCCGLRALLT